MKEKRAIMLISAILGLAAVSAFLVYTNLRNVGKSQDLIIWLETDKDVYHIKDTIQKDLARCHERSHLLSLARNYLSSLAKCHERNHPRNPERCHQRSLSQA